VRSNLQTHGFTLIEVVVALAVGATVVLLAHALIAGIGAVSGELQPRREALDRRENAGRWLSAAFSSMSNTDQGAASFDGESTHLSFSAWLQAPAGDFVLKRVDLHLEEGTLVAALDSADRVDLAEGVSGVGFDYLAERTPMPHWLRAYASPLGAPLAVRVRLARARNDTSPEGIVDTSMYIVGGP